MASDSIGLIPVPEPNIITIPPPSPLQPSLGINITLPAPMVVHTFQTGDGKAEQRFHLGSGAREWQWTQECDETERRAIRDLWEQTSGSWSLFNFDAPNEDGTTTSTTVRFASEPLAFTYSQGAATQIQIHLIETPTSDAIDAAVPGDPYYANYTTTRTLTRFADTTFNDALNAQAQTMIPLITIQPVAAGYPIIRVSDRRCHIDGVLYQARFIAHRGIGQSAQGLPNLTGQTDQVQFSFGNADRVMTQLVNSTNLEMAWVTYSIYHVASGTKLDFWAGQVVLGGWTADSSPQFTIQCSDPLQSPFLICPPRIIDHVCNAKFDDGIECPFSHRLPSDPGQSTGNDPVKFPPTAAPGDGLYDATVCDHSYDGGNGCLAHGMKYYFRGVNVITERVRVKDNTSNVLWGFGRQWVTSVSMVNDSVWGTAIPIIATNRPLIVPAVTGNVQSPLVKGYILAGIDEGDFYSAIAIVGEGPLNIGEACTLDGQFHANYPNIAKNIRIITGTVPASGGDWLSLDVKGDQAAMEAAAHGLPAWRYQYVPSSAFPGDKKEGFTVYDTYCSGVAAVMVRRSDAIGQQTPTGTFSFEGVDQNRGGYIDNHDFEVEVDTGWQGWAWTAPGSRTQVILTNPVWLALNVYLYCMRVKNADVATQETFFDVQSAIDAALVCDETVDRIVEIAEGMSTQFTYIGQIKDQRPLRDWMTDILANCLGYYSFAFGKLRFGIRYNATPIAAYTDGNMISRTLQASGIGPQFTKLILNFSDYEYNWQPNAASYQDDDYAAELGGGSRALHKIAQMNLSGTSDIDQATRIAITRGREEIGGINAGERHAARRVTFNTTILGLDTGPGDVISVYDSNLPSWTDPVSGTTFTNEILARVETYSLMPDWTVTITARFVTDSMYQYDVGPKITAVQPGQLRPPAYAAPNSPVWMPGEVFPAVGDPIYGDLKDEWTFGLRQEYNVRSDNSLQVVLVAFGKEPINLPVFGTPAIGSFTTSSTGGYLLGGRVVYMAIGLTCALGSSFTSNYVTIDIPAGTNTNSVTLQNIILPGAPTDSSGTSQPWTTITLYACMDDPTLLTSQEAYTDDPSVVSGGSWTIAGTSAVLPLDRARDNPPSPNYAGILIKAKYLIHGGVVGMPVTDVQTGTITSNGLATGADDWTGRVISVVAAPLGQDTPLWNFLCTAYDNTTGTFTVTPDPLAAGVPLLSVLTVRFQADTFDSTHLGDSKQINSIYPLGETDSLTNAQIRIIEGAGRKQIRKIISNTTTVYTVDPPWDVNPDANSFWVVETRDWMYESDVILPQIRVETPVIAPKLTMDNLDLWPVLVGGFMVDRQNNVSKDEETPVRDTYLFGTGQGYAPVTVTADYTILPDDQVVFVDTSLNDVTITAPAPDTYNHEVVIKRNSATTNTNVAHVISPAKIDGKTTSIDLTDEGQSITILGTN